ncbi:MAG TPA: hypothetical protein VFA18_25355 [Gemmataceae bacterium]|nr:hypothetical protein [Gemmataceae bacterium]
MDTLSWLLWLLLAVPFGLLLWMLTKRQKSRDEFHVSNEYHGPQPW